MANDEILWKNIEALIQKRPQPSAEKQPRAANRSPAGKQAPSSGQDARKLASKQTIPLETKPSLTHASTLARYQDSTIEEIRKIVKTVGREVAFARVTPEEKRQLVDMVYSLKRQGVRTSENEIVRIAVNFMLSAQ